MSASGRQFTIGSYLVDEERGRLSFSYETVLADGTKIPFKDIVEFQGTTAAMWERLPREFCESFVQALSIMRGMNYWKAHTSPKIVIEGFSLTREQAAFWDTLYTKGLGEFFYKSNIDFRGLIAFPYESRLAPTPTRFPRQDRSLLANGGGKDTVVSAEMLKEHGIPFDIFEWGISGTQQRLRDLIGRPSITVLSKRDPRLAELWRAKNWHPAYPSISAVTLFGMFAAALHDYRYVVFSNEQSADIGNVTYLGLDVNHQWSKSTEAEHMIREYMNGFISPDVSHISLLRRFSEIETTRRFAAYPRYFKTFLSCGVHFYKQAIAPRADGGSYWCTTCPKCVFIFACLSAFLPKATVTGIFGRDLYADTALLPIFKRLLGLEGHKPFICVGAPEEMIVAMVRAAHTGEYSDDPALELVGSWRDPGNRLVADMEKRVFSGKPADALPGAFASL